MSPRRLSPLTEQQHTIAAMVALAMPDKEIAAKLGVSVESVKGAVKEIYRKLQIPAAVNRRVFLANQINRLP